MTQTTFTDNVLVDGSQDTTQLRVQGHTTQTQPLQTWENSAGTPLARVSGDGYVQVGDDLLGWSTPDALIEAHRADTSSAKPKRGFYSLGKINNLLTDILTWAIAELQLLGSAGVSGLQTALRARLTHSNTGTSTAAELRAGDFETVNQTGASGARVGQATGVRGTANNTPSGASAYLSKAVGVEGKITNAAGGDITDATAFEVAAPTNSGTIANLYGLRIPDLIQGVVNYAIHTGLGIVRFGDFVELKRPTAVPGTPATDILRVYPKSDGKLYAKNWSGTEYELSGSNLVIAGVCDGRLSLTSYDPIPQNDVISATTLYFVPYKGNQVGLYNGSFWTLYPFTERSLSLSGLSANTNYDIFLYDNAGTLTLEAVAWSTDFARATELYKLDGIFVKSGETNKRYLGTIATTSAGQTEDSVKKRFVYNEYHPVTRPLKVVETTASWTYSAHGWRVANNSSANQIEVVIGNFGPLALLNLVARVDSASGAAHGIGYDTGNSVTGDIYTDTVDDGHISAHIAHHPTIGKHKYSWMENAQGAASTVYGVTTDRLQSGMSGQITL